MASFNKAISTEFFESILPAYGQPRASVPVWNEAQRMFLCGQYESVRGNRYFMGVRFCDKVVVVEKIGMHHSWTYIDGIELYAFNGKRLELVQKRDYEKVFRKDEFVRKETESMLFDYMKSTIKMNRCDLPDEQILSEAGTVVDSCYKSFLDSDYNVTLNQILLQIEK